MPRPRPRTLAALTGTGLLAGLVAFAAPAAAHVTVSSTEAKPGGYGVVALRVPTESATASTVKIELQLPTATPLASVAVQATPGWTDTEVTGKLPTAITTDDGPITTAVTRVTWTATAGGIKPGHFQQFFLDVGPFPTGAKPLVFSAIQHYSDGTTVAWNQQQAPGQSQEPEHPAPTLDLTGTATTTGATGSTGVTTTASSASKSSGGSDTGALVLSIVALVVAVGGVGLGVVSRARSRGTS